MIALSAALAAPVLCDPGRATRLLEDAHIAPERVPITQPNLLPGLARDQAEPAVVEVLDGLCREDAPLSLAPAEHWENAAFSAYSFILTRSSTEGCRLIQDAVVLTVGIEPGEPLRYGIRSRLPTAEMALAECDAPSRYRSETLLDGAGTPVRLVRVSDHEGDEASHRVVVRRATPAGWVEQVLLDPAPPRLTGEGDGPRLSLHVRDDDVWIVAHGDRQFDGDRCTPVPGQTLWRWDGEKWESLGGRDALGRLADRGAWRLAGEDGWVLILAQDIPSDRDLVEARMRRVQRRNRDRVSIRESASFPGLNPGFLIVSPDPWPSREEAEAARRVWGRRTGVYVKQAWEVVDPCE